MTKTHTTDFVDQKTEKLIEWFVGIEEIPLRSRRDFLLHIRTEKGLDEKAAKFIVDSLNGLLTHHKEKAEKLKKEYEFYSALLVEEDTPETSLRYRIVEEAEEFFKTVVDQIDKHEKTKAQAQEQQESQSNNQEISTIKKGL